jgi:hypothetical protein
MFLGFRVSDGVRIRVEGSSLGFKGLGHVRA